MTRLPRKAFEFAFFAAIAIAVGGFGGTVPVAWGISEILVFALGLILVLFPEKTAAGTPYRKLLWFPAVLAAWIFVQWLLSRAGRIAADPYAVESRGLAVVTALVAFFVALEIAKFRESRRRFVFFLIALGVFEALYGLAEYLAGWQYIWNVPRRYYRTAATGTYVNHNHFAGFLEMVMPLALALALYHWRKSRRRSRRSISGLLELLGDSERLKSLLFALAAALMLVSIVFSFSRMGMIAVLFSLAVMAAVISTTRRRDASAATPVRALLIVSFLVAAVAIVAWLGVGPVVHRFELLPQNEPLAVGGQGRVALWHETLPLLRAHPWAGIGLGGFPYAFTRLQHMKLTFVFDYAHNDYLQMAIELGIPCAAALFALLYWLVFRTLLAGVRSRSEFTRAVALGSLAGAAALLLHSAADFNLYIPANALVFASVLGLGYAQWLELRAEAAVNFSQSAAASATSREAIAASESPSREPSVPAAVHFKEST
jgi:O-antigen ligase